MKHGLGCWSLRSSMIVLKGRAYLIQWKYVCFSMSLAFYSGLTVCTNNCRSSHQGRRPYLLEEPVQEREALRTVEGKVGRVLGPSPVSPVKLPFLSVYMLVFHGRFYLEKSFQGDWKNMFERYHLHSRSRIPGSIILDIVNYTRCLNIDQLVHQ